MNLLYFFIFSQNYFLFYYSNPLNSLYFLHPGFLDVSQGDGIIGAHYNPASIGAGGKIEGSFFFNKGSKETISFDIPVGVDSIGGTEIPKFDIPFNLEIEDKGGMGFIGGKFSINLFSIGIGYYEEDKFGAGLALETVLSQSVDFTISDYISKADHPDIPDNVSIPVKFRLKGDIGFELDGEGGINSSLSPFFVAVGRGFGPLKIGLGINFKKYKGEADLYYSIKGNSEGVSIELKDTVEDNRGEQWILDANIEGSLKSTELFRNEITGFFQGNQIGISSGILVHLPVIKLGLAVEYSLPFIMKGRVEGISTYIDEIPSALIDENQIIVDTISNTITGNVRVDSLYFLYSTNTMRYIRENMQFPGMFGIKGGINLNLLLFGIDLAGGIDIPTGDYVLGKAYFMLASGFGIGPIRTRLGSVFSWRYLKYQDLFFFTPPSITFGLGANIRVQPVEFYGGIYTTPFMGTLSFVKKIGGEGETFVNPFKTMSINLGVRVKI